jgi:hypothetical protein
LLILPLRDFSAVKGYNHPLAFPQLWLTGLTCYSVTVGVVTSHSKWRQCAPGSPVADLLARNHKPPKWEFQTNKITGDSSDVTFLIPSILSGKEITSSAFEFLEDYMYDSSMVSESEHKARYRSYVSN